MRIALITGGTSGIGAACVRRLAADGCKVAFTYRSDAEAAAELADEVEGKAYRLDLTDVEAQGEVLARLESEVGKVGVLVHNAGATRDTLLPFLTEETWHEVLEVNLHAVYRLTRALLRGMLQARWGRVVTIASLSGVIGHAGQAHYSAAKAGLIGFTKALALESAKFNVTANAVAPGFIDTDMLNAIPEAKMKAYLDAIPLRRLGTPDEVAALVGYLVSDAAAYMTGQTLRLDGGLVMA